MPGLGLSFLGVMLASLLSFENLRLGPVVLDVGTLTVACMTVIIGIQLVAFAFFTKVFAIAEGLLPQDPKLTRVFKQFTLEKGIVAGLLLFAAGSVLSLRALWIWKQADYGVLPYAENLRRLIPATTLVIVGIQTIFSSFFMSVLGLKTISRKPPASSSEPRKGETV